MKRLAMAGLVMVTAGCHTFMKVRPDFQAVPEETLREVAMEVEQAIRNGDREAVIESRGGVVVDSDEIRQAIRTRAARSALVDAFLTTGHAWERSNGTIAIIRSKEYKNLGTKRDRDRNALMVMSENADRWALYEGIQDASNFPPRSLPAIQRAFFDARVALLEDGQKYEATEDQPSAK